MYFNGHTVRFLSTIINMKASGVCKDSANGPPLWYGGQRSWVRFPVLLHFLHSSVSGTGSIQPREDK
jgi:hypothetical protein